jgi:hypothetical protein
LVVGVELEVYEMRGFMSTIFQRNIKTILSMGGVGFVIVFIATVRVILRTGSESLRTHHTRHLTTIPHSTFNVTALDTPRASRHAIEP